MTIVEAIKSGRKFRRSGSGIWLSVKFETIELAMEDVAATDWEILPERRCVKFRNRNSNGIACSEDVSGDHRPVCFSEHCTIWERVNQ